MLDYVQDLYGGRVDEERFSRLKYMNKFLSAYLKKAHKKIEYYKRKFIVKITDYLPSWILGMTDCKGTIWLKRFYGYLRERVLRHEINHNLFPGKSEYEIERLTNAGHPKDLSLFRLIFV